MSNQNIEEQHQIALIKWARYSVEQYPQLKLLHSSLNGIKLPIGLAKKAKAGGMLAGVWDLFLPVSLEDYWSGLYIEMKSKTGKLTKEQVWFKDQLKDKFLFVVVRDWRDGRDILVEYLSGKSAVKNMNHG